MTSNSKKRSSSKKLHIFSLRMLILFSVLLLIVTLALQVMNIVFPVEVVQQSPSLLGKPSNPFVFTQANIFPFLLAPLILLIVGYLYLKKYLSRNSISAMDHIPYFRKHPHTVFGRRFCNAFATVVIVASVILAFVNTVYSGASESWFGTVTVIGCAVLLCFSAKTLRHTRRQYFAHRKNKPTTKDGNK